MSQEEKEINEVVIRLNSNSSLKPPCVLRLQKKFNRAGGEYYFYDENQNVLTIKTEGDHLIFSLTMDDKS